MTVVGALPSGSGAAIVNPSAPGSVLFSYSPSGTGTGIYSNTSISAAGANTIVAPSFDSVSMLQVTPDGSTLVFIASTGGVSSLYSVATTGGSTLRIAAADTAALSADGTKIAYSSQTTTGEMLSVMALTGENVSTLTPGTSVDLYPQFSRDGSTLIFSSNRAASGASSVFDLYTINLSSRAITRVTNSSNSSKFGASFNDQGTQISYVSLSTDQTSATGVWVCNSNGTSPSLIWTSDSVGASTYWSSATGRAPFGPHLLFQKLSRTK